MSESAITFVVLGVVVVLFVSNRFPPEIVALGAAIALYAAGVLDSHQVFAGFGDPVVPFLAGLFVISEGLDASGVTGWAGQQLISGRRHPIAADPDRGVGRGGRYVRGPGVSVDIARRCHGAEPT